ncbi:hypothetical protein AB0E11_05205 [Streptomyces fradiae]|uniref:hypothetical protein n=1 Tax=Streptomyces fradiae TaxID=1906 RepID=UPI0033C95611
MRNKIPRSRQPARAATAALGGALLAALVAVVRRRAARTADRPPLRALEPEPAGPADPNVQDTPHAGRGAEAEGHGDLRVVAPGVSPAPVAPPPGPARSADRAEAAEPPPGPAEPVEPALPPGPPADPEAPHHRA